MFTVSFYLELRKVRNNNPSLAAVVNEYMVRAKNLKKKEGEEELDGMALRY